MKTNELEILKLWAINMQNNATLNCPIVLHKTEKEFYQLIEYVPESDLYYLFSLSEGRTIVDYIDKYYFIEQYIDEMKLNSNSDNSENINYNSFENKSGDPGYIGEPDFEVIDEMPEKEIREKVEEFKEIFEKDNQKNILKKRTKDIILWGGLTLIIFLIVILFNSLSVEKNTEKEKNPHVIRNTQQPAETENFNKAIQIWQKSHGKKIYQWRRTQLKDYVKKHEAENLMETVKLINEYNTEVEPIEK